MADSTAGFPGDQSSASAPFSVDLNLDIAQTKPITSLNQQ